MKFFQLHYKNMLLVHYVAENIFHFNKKVQPCTLSPFTMRQNKHTHTHTHTNSLLFAIPPFAHIDNT